MALFKPLLGNSSSLDNIEKHAGYVYFCVDDGSLHFDYLDNDNNLQRKQINAEEAKKLTGYDIKTIINDSEVEIPTSKAVLDALNLKQDVITGVEGQYVGFDADGAATAKDPIIDEDARIMMTEFGLITPAGNETTLLTDDEGKIFII